MGMNETRVNLQHLLEDIRDSYAMPLEEVIITELVANSLDSGASRIEFRVNPDAQTLCCIDNGRGMRRAQLREYHNIAASVKVRGTGIGFAGIGAKLSLLVSSKVITESKGGHGTKAATEWHLASSYRAPWKFVSFGGTVATPRGTAVTIFFGSNQPFLLSEEFVAQTIQKHFYPLLCEKFMRELLCSFYKKGVTFIINERPLVLNETPANPEYLKIYLGQSRKPLGIGFLAKTIETPSWLQRVVSGSADENNFYGLPGGLAISTFGKVIKSGWEWLGISPKSSEDVIGIVEIPALAELLTTNKMDFLRDAANLKKFYRYRKAMQEAVRPILIKMGAFKSQTITEPSRLLKPLNQSIASTLADLVNDFPELSSLLGNRFRKALGKEYSASKLGESNVIGKVVRAVEARAQEPSQSSNSERLPEGRAGGVGAKIKTKKAGLELRFEELEISDSVIPMGRLIEDILYINTNHPAWHKAQAEGLAEYHIVITVAVTLSEFLEADRSSQDFMSTFLCHWGRQYGADKLI